MSKLPRNFLKELVIVIPVYNEEASIAEVIDEWQKELSKWTGHFHFLVINDGSTDGTSQLLGKIAKASGVTMTIINQENTGLRKSEHSHASSLPHLF